ncbi:MAG: hypothetical protein LBD88_01030 [Candidatus Peribacteria bacterium]|nr:hypothetical protein [Candidatus Peribacteria bacterium]
MLANKTIVANIDNGVLTENIVTDNQGKATFELLTSKHFKLGNSVENGGVSGTETSVYYTNYSFLEGDNKSEDISIDMLKGLDKVVLA